MLTRRRLLTAGLASASANLLGCRKVLDTQAIRAGLMAPPSPLEPAAGLLALPPGFSYVVLQSAGDLMSDGLPMPPQPDGMTCHLDADGNYVLLRNHELGNTQWLTDYGLDPNEFATGRVDVTSDQPLGGVSKVTLSQRKLSRAFRGRGVLGHEAIIDSRLILNATDRNCSGGHTPEGWITCEESGRDGHGWAYRTQVTDTGLVDRDERRLPSWGRFQREGIALDGVTGIAYQTEDHGVGALYRHVPNDPSIPYGPGRLQALRIAGVVHTDRHNEHGILLDPDGPPLPVGRPYAVEWVDIPDPAATERPCREQALDAGASLFTRGEGITQAPDGRVWFSATSGGPQQAGQLWRIDPANSTLTLVYEVTDPAQLSLPDNLIVTPWGDLLMAEDNYHPSERVRQQHLRALTADGALYDIARNERVDWNDPTDCGAEFTGPCFSPDGKVLFVNLQYPEGATVAITGPWPRGSVFS